MPNHNQCLIIGVAKDIIKPPAVEPEQPPKQEMSVDSSELAAKIAEQDQRAMELEVIHQEMVAVYNEQMAKLDAMMVGKVVADGTDVNENAQANQQPIPNIDTVEVQRIKHAIDEKQNQLEQLLNAKAASKKKKKSTKTNTKTKATDQAVGKESTSSTSQRWH